MRQFKVDNKLQSGHNYVERKDVIVKRMWKDYLSTYPHP